MWIRKDIKAKEKILGDFKMKTLYYDKKQASFYVKDYRKKSKKILSKLEFELLLEEENIEEFRKQMNELFEEQNELLDMEVKIKDSEYGYKWKRIILQKNFLKTKGIFRKDKINGVIYDVDKRKNEDAKLRSEKIWYEKIFSESPIGSMISDSFANIVKVNSKFAKMLGYTPSELQGKSMELIYSDMNRESKTIEIAGETLEIKKLS